MTDAANAEDLIAAIDREHGRLDILVNNAAVSVDDGRRALESLPDDVRETFETNVVAPWRLIQLVVPLMRRNDYGRIVNVSSEVAQFARIPMSQEWPAYTLSKAALNALTLLIAEELAETNILVNAASPGFCRTGMSSSVAPFSAAEGADVSVFLATLPDGGPTGKWFFRQQAIPW